MADQSILSFFTNASGVVQTVMLILLLASILSWTLIIQRFITLRTVKTGVGIFHKQFWSGTDLPTLYSNTNKAGAQCSGTAAIFKAGYHEFAKLQQHGVSGNGLLEGIERAMRVSCAREIDRLEQNLSILATIGSVSPYVGLFGTVWGIMTSFQALGSVQQATIAMVAPGISEALIATAMGLFAAIPAVIAYNRFASSVERLGSEYDNFQDEFVSILSRQLLVQE